MDRLSIFENYDTIAVRQTRKGCLQTMCGCDANEQYKITAKDSEDPIMMANEETDFCIRLVCSGARPFKIKLHIGDNQIAEVDRPFRLQAAACKVDLILLILFFSHHFVIFS